MKKMIMAAAVLMSCQSYNRYNVAGHGYSIDGDVKIRALIAVEDLGLRTETFNSKTLTTRWETLYDKDNEYTSRVVINFETSKVKGQCLQRRVRRRGSDRAGPTPWYFRACHGTAAEYVSRNVDEIVSAITL